MKAGERAVSGRGARSTWRATSRSGAPTKSRAARATSSAAAGTNRAIASRAGRAQPVGRDEHVWRPAGKNRGPRRAARAGRSRHGGSQTVVPVSDELLAVYRRFYDYDRTPLDARVDVGRHARHWRKKRSASPPPTAMNGSLRILFLPKNVKPPYQTVVLFPSRYARRRRRANLDLHVSSSSSAVGARCCTRCIRVRSSARRAEARSAPSVDARATCRCSGSRTSSERSTTSRRGRRSTRAARVLQPEHGRVLRTDPDRPRTADQGGRLRVRRSPLHRAAEIQPANFCPGSRSRYCS